MAPLNVLPLILEFSNLQLFNSTPLNFILVKVTLLNVTFFKVSPEKSYFPIFSPLMTKFDNEMFDNEQSLFKYSLYFLWLRSLLENRSIKKFLSHFLINFIVLLS